LSRGPGIARCSFGSSSAYRIRIGVQHQRLWTIWRSWGQGRLSYGFAKLSLDPVPVASGCRRDGPMSLTGLEWSPAQQPRASSVLTRFGRKVLGAQNGVPSGSCSDGRYDSTKIAAFCAAKAAAPCYPLASRSVALQSWLQSLVHAVGAMSQGSQRQVLVFRCPRLQLAGWYSLGNHRSTTAVGNPSFTGERVVGETK
jgi:hypothetical protein